MDLCLGSVTIPLLGFKCCDTVTESVSAVESGDMNEVWSCVCGAGLPAWVGYVSKRTVCALCVCICVCLLHSVRVCVLPSLSVCVCVYCTLSGRMCMHADGWVICSAQLCCFTWSTACARSLAE